MSYNKSFIEARKIRDLALKLAAVDLIGKEQLAAIISAFKDPLYVPSVFVRIGLMIFSFILVNAGMGIMFVLFSGAFSNESAAGVLLILYSFVAIGFLEYFIKNKNHFRSGIDDCLLFTGVSFFIGGVILTGSLYDAKSICLVALPVILAATWRYADSLSAASAFICFYVLTFLVLKDFEFGRTWMPFIFLGISSVLVYFFSRQLKNDALTFYETCLSVLKILSLVMLYASMNYFVVREGNMLLNGLTETEFVDLSQPANLVQYRYEIPLAWLFIAITMVIPIAYIFFALKWKDRLLLWTGLGIVVLSVATFKYRFQIMPVEQTMTWCGLFLVVGTWWVIRYLKSHTNRFTFAHDPTSSNHDLLNAEALLISQTLVKSAPEPQQGFGGGSFGGGGAGGSI